MKRLLASALVEILGETLLAKIKYFMPLGVALTQSRSLFPYVKVVLHLEEK